MMSRMCCRPCLRLVTTNPLTLLLLVSQFFAGIIGNSSAMIADAGHSLSDLLSDAVTLWAVRLSRLPPDEDHPYGHGR